MQQFEELGNTIERRWRDANYREGSFSAVASQALLEARLHERVSPWDVVRWVFTSTVHPQQEDIEARFGAPPVTVYRGRRFFVSILYWLDGTTTIHQHAFSGAFQVLAGSSIHGEYGFDQDREINAQMLEGRIGLERMELLRQGDVRPILAGRSFIHSLFHLKRPSVSIVVRTYHDATSGPQYDYRRPRLAVDPFFREQSTVRSVQCASLLLSSRPPEWRRMLDDLVEHADFETAYFVLDRLSREAAHGGFHDLFKVSEVTGLTSDLLEVVRRRHGELADALPPVFAEQRRQQFIVERRAQTTEADHRFFLALLLNAPDRETALRLAIHREPERDPVEALCQWIGELSNTRRFGSSEASVLGIEPLDDDELLVLSGLLAGRSHDEIAATIRDVYPPEDAEDLLADVPTIAGTLRGSVLRPLLE